MILKRDDYLVKLGYKRLPKKSNPMRIIYVKEDYDKNYSKSIHLRPSYKGVSFKSHCCEENFSRKEIEAVLKMIDELGWEE